MKKQSYAIIGAGALGGLYGGMLARAGHEVHFLFHNDYHHVVRYGLKVDTIWGDFHLRDVHAHASSDSMPPCDVTIIALKTTQNHLLGELLLDPTRGQGVALVLQNGLAVEDDTAAVIGASRVLGGCCFLCSNKVAPGHIRHIDYGRIVFGKYIPQNREIDSTALRISDEFNAAGIDAEYCDDLAMVRWRKLMWNIPFNGLSVVLDASTKQIMDDPHAFSLAESIIREVHQGAAACLVRIDEEMIEKTLDHTRKMVPYDSSMRLDFLNRRPMEIEAIVGKPLRAAQAAGFEMPRVEMLYRQLKYIDQRIS